MVQARHVRGVRAAGLLPEGEDELPVPAEEGVAASFLRAFAQHTEVERVAVEGERAVQVGDVQAHVPVRSVLMAVVMAGPPQEPKRNSNLLNLI
ncbi:hypothetical protein SF23_19380 [Streptomyces sp. MBRL 10]|nr:hypothetical protein SF23_19380 [Streptomyces sp. MBRL 10]